MQICVHTLTHTGWPTKSIPSLNNGCLEYTEWISLSFHGATLERIHSWNTFILR